MLLRAVHVIVPALGVGRPADLPRCRSGRRAGPGPDHQALPARRRAGRRTVLFFLLSPCAIFLAVGYTEALFLAFALPAWLAAQRRNWPLAMTLTAVATAVRVSGCSSPPHSSRISYSPHAASAMSAPLPWLALPALPLSSSAGICRPTPVTGWPGSMRRNVVGSATFHAPWEAWQPHLANAFDHAQSTGYAFMFQAELLGHGHRPGPDHLLARNAAGPRPSTSASVSGRWEPPTGTPRSPAPPSCGGRCGSPWQPGACAAPGSRPPTSAWYTVEHRVRPDLPDGALDGLIGTRGHGRRAFVLRQAHAMPLQFRTYST